MKKLYTAFTLAFGLSAAVASAQCNVTYTYTTNGLTINATATGTGTAMVPTYGWDWGDTQISVGQAQSHTYSAPGTYTVCAYFFDLADTASCNATSCQQVTVTATNIVESQKFKLEAGAYPNPFDNKTSIIYSVTHPSDVTIEVYDMLGKKVASLLNDNVSAGQHTIDWSTVSIPSGVYFLQVKAGDFIINKKILKN